MRHDIDEIRIWTIGHSTRRLDDFIEIAASYDLKHIVDVRSYPGSRRVPHFSREFLARSLGKAGICYTHIAELGGRRSPRSDSRNTYWKNAGFRGYADYMESAEFGEGAERLLDIAARESTAIMCAEALWWRCHRALIADFLKANGARVTHILGVGKSEEHPFSRGAQVIEGRLSYIGEEAERS